MCGIVGGIAQRNVTPLLLEGLKRLEYRGYDSAGIAILSKEGVLQRERSKGKVAILEDAIQRSPLQGALGVGHTRWATHGMPATRNAHPHICRGSVAVVHNGIIENYELLREEQLQAGHQFTSDTDTEVIVHAVYDELQTGANLLTAVQNSSAKLEGAFALGVMYKDSPGELVAARFGSPLVIGIGIGEHFIASDVFALLPMTSRFIFLEEGDVARLTCDSVEIYDVDGVAVERQVKESAVSAERTRLGEYRHYMQKEIFEQPSAAIDALEGRVSVERVIPEAFGMAAAAIFEKVRRVQVVACGTSFHAGLVARYWMEQLAGIPCQVEVASEFRYRESVVEDDTLFVTLSQSGETADTLAALRKADQQNYLSTLTICNVPESSLVRESELSLLTHAGPEIGVASTKAFTTQLIALLLLIISIARQNNMSAAREKEIVAQLRRIPAVMDQLLGLDQQIALLAEHFIDKHHALFLGRGSHYPIAMEGALKLKEISYIHAEAYPAGELKHGPLALIDEDMPVVAVAPDNKLFAKLKSNLEEVRARGGELFLFAGPGVSIAESERIHQISLPKIDAVTAPILYTLPLQMLSYHVAVLKGTDVDQPRNLAKSVTVE
ncbi:MAG TPA: glutamine--fructose-6-phosphate transaminase (isomerizing) [Gammaproteobacteria bacterium]|nr:glutamine--fructose-6-phosphate transaminase (isomerizing) [Gammaproteobacteria bacterium]